MYFFGIFLTGKTDSAENKVFLELKDMSLIKHDIIVSFFHLNKNQVNFRLKQINIDLKID